MENRETSINNEIPIINIDCMYNSNNLADKEEASKSSQVKEIVTTTICRWCNASVTGTSVRWLPDSVIPSGALIDHIRKCDLFLGYKDSIT